MSEDLLRQIQQELQKIRVQSEKQTHLISNASTYAVGYAIAFGMNVAVYDSNYLKAAIVALLSWVNVGFTLVKYLGQTT